MHIGFRTSGGRGEYEVIGTHSGYTAASLEGWSFYMLWPDGIVRDTRLWLDPGESGKPRLRSTARPAIQIGRIVASMLLLPDPIRTRDTNSSDFPVIQAKKYSITQVGFSPESDFSGILDRVTFKPSWIEATSSAGTEPIGVDARWRRVESVYKQAAELPGDTGHYIDVHQTFLASGQPVDARLPDTVKQLCQSLTRVRGLDYVEGHDPLPALEQLLGIPATEEPSLPPPDELSEDEPEISTRSAFEYRLSKMRGPSGRQFSATVREAYGHQCAFCGAKLSGLTGIPSGVDAAHILAWSRHDLDVVANGLALCKLHHWAFDASIMLPVFEDGEYAVQYTTLAERIDDFSRARLGPESQPIRREWLPENPAQHPSQQYLRRLYADLGVTFMEETR